MLTAAISILVLAIVLGVIVWIIQKLIALLPMAAGFKEVANGLVILLAVAVLLAKALPLLGIPVPF